MQSHNIRQKEVKARINNSTIPASVLPQIESLVNDNIPPVVYTAYDGDLLYDSEIMNEHALREGLIPLNAMLALDAYLAANHYHGDKSPIILDCFSLLARCDEFWIMIADSATTFDKEFYELPEGVIIEALYWLKHSNKSVEVRSIQTGNSITSFDNWQSLFVELKPNQKESIEEHLSIGKHELRDVVYLTAEDSHMKHTNWMRKTAYKQSRVPLCPHNLMNKYTIRNWVGESWYAQVLPRVTYASLADEYWIFSKEHNFSLDSVTGVSLLELYTFLKTKKQKIQYVPFAEAGVPKYTDRSQWAITEHEADGFD